MNRKLPILKPGKVYDLRKLQQVYFFLNKEEIKKERQEKRLKLAQKTDS